MAAHNVVIFSDKYACGVKPPDLFANPGDTIRFLNATGSDVVIEFADGAPSGIENPFTISSEQPRRPFTVDGGAQFGGYPYTAFCQSQGLFAQASVPRIIIYPTEA